MTSASFATGAVIGNLVYTVARDRLPRYLTFAVGFLIGGAPRFLALGLGAPVWTIAAVGFAAGLGLAAVNPILGAVSYERVPERLIARVMGLSVALSWAGIPLGSLLGGLAGRPARHPVGAAAGGGGLPGRDAAPVHQQGVARDGLTTGPAGRALRTARAAIAGGGGAQAIEVPSADAPGAAGLARRRRAPPARCRPPARPRARGPRPPVAPQWTAWSVASSCRTRPDRQPTRDGYGWTRPRSTSGIQARRACLAASRAVSHQRCRARSPRSSRHWATDRDAAHGTITSTPTSVIACTASSPRSPLAIPAPRPAAGTGGVARTGATLIVGLEAALADGGDHGRSPAPPRPSPSSRASPDAQPLHVGGVVALRPVAARHAVAVRQRVDQEHGALRPAHRAPTEPITDCRRC